MRRRPRKKDSKAISFKKPLSAQTGDIGLVLSGGGSRAAYQIGAIKALAPYLSQSKNPIKIIVGSSIGAINGLLLGACLKDGIDHAVEVIEGLWKERTFKNTFTGSPSGAFVRAIKLAVMQYLYPGPNPNTESVFNPAPLMKRVDDVIKEYGGLLPKNRVPNLETLAVMTTIEGEQRRPLLFASSHKEIDPILMKGATFEVCYVNELHAKHGFASAALPSVLPPVELDTQHGTVKLVDGGICQNVPVDPVVRFGAERVIVVDISGRDWWLDHFDEAHDTRPDWEVPAGDDTFCLRPPDTFIIRARKPLGELLRNAVSHSRKKFIAAVGPTWPVFALLKNKFGEEVAYETLSYVALDPDYIRTLIERGYNETIHLLRNRVEPEYTTTTSYEDLVEQVVG